MVLTLLGHGATATQLKNNDPKTVQVCQDVAKGLMDLCGVELTMEGLRERDLDAYEQTPAPRAREDR